MHDIPRLVSRIISAWYPWTLLRILLAMVLYNIFPFFLKKTTTEDLHAFCRYRYGPVFILIKQFVCITVLYFNVCYVKLWTWIINFIPYFWGACDCSSMLGLRLTHVSKIGLGVLHQHYCVRNCFSLSYIQDDHPPPPRFETRLKFKRLEYRIHIHHDLSWTILNALGAPQTS